MVHPGCCRIGVAHNLTESSSTLARSGLSSLGDRSRGITVATDVERRVRAPRSNIVRIRDARSASGSLLSVR